MTFASAPGEELFAPEPDAGGERVGSNIRLR
jgi:hypothetical protein